METKIRLTKLDGLRGILALIVALNHSFLVIAIPGFANVWGQNYLVFHDLQSKIQQLFMILGNGGVAVTMFFVLSGYVMGQSLSRVNITLNGLTGFFVKRLLRLYPVYLFIVILTALYMKYGFEYLVFPSASTWYQWWMNFPMNFREFIYNVFFIHAYIGGVTWTLRVILIASFIFPALYFLTRKTSPILDLVIAASLIVASFTILNLQGFRDLRYIYIFYFGLMIPHFERFFTVIPGWLSKITVPLVAIIMLIIRYQTDEYYGGVIETIIAWYILGLMIYNSKTGIFNWLNHRLPQFLGQISYSLYLIHFSVLYIMARLMFVFFPGLPYASNYLLIHFLLFVISATMATMISIPVYRYLEKPSASLGKRLSLKLLRP